MTVTQIQLLAGDRQPRETDAAVCACNDYLRMGVGRSVRNLQQKYSESTAEPPPTKTLRVLFRWSSEFQWQERASAYDAAQDAAKTAEIARLRTEGLAADYERIRELDSLYRLLRTELDDRGVWHTDIKLSSRGDQVEVEVINKALIDSLRNVLDDIAKEVGGRKERKEISGPGGGPIQVEAVESALLKTYGNDSDSTSG